MVAKSIIGRPPSCDCGQCKKCERKEYMRRWYQSKTIEQRRVMLTQRNPDVVRLNEAKRFQRHKVKRMKLAKEWRKKHPVESKEMVRRWNSSNPEKKRAHSMVAAAIARGDLRRPECCERCQQPSGDIEGHHGDYSKPLEVEWLCVACHGMTRRKQIEV